LPVIDQYRLGSQLVAAMNYVDFGGVPGEKVALFDSGVPTADHGQLLALEKGAIAHGTVADTAPPELLLAGDPQVSGQAAGGHDQGRSAKLLSRLQPDNLGVAFDVDLEDRLEVAHLEAELAGVVAHLGRQL